jgi:hypothetical protein
MQEIIVCHSFFSLTSFSQNYLLMQTIRRFLLIVPFLIMSICSLNQEQTEINQPLPIVEITFDSYTLNLFPQVKTIQPILLNIELDVNDHLFMPYVQSAI